MQLLHKILKTYLTFIFYISGFLAIPRFPITTALIRFGLITWLSLMAFQMFYIRMNGGDSSLGGLVGCVSFVLNSWVNIIIILESICKAKHDKQLKKLQNEIDELLEIHLGANLKEDMHYDTSAKYLLAILLSQLICDILKIWINSLRAISPVFWYFLPITVSLRTRYVQIIISIMTMNGRIRILKESMKTLAKNNEPKSKYGSDIWQPYDPKVYNKVNYMRFIYLRIWEVFRILNNIYSWSLLSLFISSFFDILCNCFWTLDAIHDKYPMYHKYVMNGATSVSLITLVVVQFYYTDASEQNNKFYKSAVLLMYLGYWTFGLAPFTHYLLYQVFICLWYCEIAWSTHLVVANHAFGSRHGINALVSVILYVTHMLGHVTVLAESCRMRRYRVALVEQYGKIQFRLKEELKKPRNADISAFRLSLAIYGFLFIVATGHGIIMWTTFKTKSAVSLLYWRSLQSYLALHYKTLEFLIALVNLSYYIKVIRKTLNEMGERNLRKVFKTDFNTKANSKIIIVASCHEEQEDEKLLRNFKNCYNEIFSTFQIYNEAYGWSLLASTAVYFVDFVCNSYWILVAILNQERDYYILLQNICFAFLAFVSLCMLCWLAEECYYESRYIGCLISKLVKPLGNKYYNDLVSEFSVQTLHQRFIITAKEFFSLNLSLLGRMIAAIVTYLIILIQFMLTEENRAITNKTDLVTSTTPIPGEIMHN